MACHNCPSSTEKGPNSPSNNNDKDAQSLSTRALRLMSAVLPEGSALLSSSCCWVPALLDLAFAGSITAASIQRLRPIFLTISIMTLAWKIWRQGLVRSNIRRAIICACLLVWAQYNEYLRGKGRRECCHR